MGRIRNRLQSVPGTASASYRRKAREGDGFKPYSADLVMGSRDRTLCVGPHRGQREHIGCVLGRYAILSRAPLDASNCVGRY